MTRANPGRRLVKGMDKIMVFFQWKEEYEIGLPHIDLQHTMIVNMMNELFIDLGSKKSPNTIKKTLDNLLIYIEEHFATEEEAMTEIDYPDLDAHLCEHEKFRADVEELTKRHREEDNIAASELIEFLKNWLRHHIAEVDKKFGIHAIAINEQARINRPE